VTRDHVPAEPLARGDVVQQDRSQGADRNVADAAHAERDEQLLERRVGRGEHGELAVAVEDLDEAGPDDGCDEVIELAGPGVDRERGRDDGRARLPGRDGLGREAEDEGAGGGEEGETSHGNGLRWAGMKGLPARQGDGQAVCSSDWSQPSRVGRSAMADTPTRA